MFKSNAILFKDLLISLNSKLWKNLIISFSFVYFVVFLLILSAVKQNYGSFDLSWYGKEIFRSTWIFQLFTLMFIWYIKWLLSISSEKSRNTFEFVSISMINAKNFILWKFLSIFTYIFLLFAISLPFFSIWLILWWVNINNVFIYVLYSITYISISIIVWMFFSILSEKFSLVMWIWAIPVVIFLIALFFGIIPWDFVYFNDKIFYSIFPVALFENVDESQKYINFFWLNIHYLIHHIVFYFSIFLFFLVYLINKYKSNSNLNQKSYYYLWSFISFLTFLFISPAYSEGFFYIIFLFFVFNYLFFLFNENLFNKWIYKENIIYFYFSFLVWIIVLTIVNWFSINTILLYFSVFFTFFAIYSFFIKFFKNLWRWLTNLYFFVFLTLFFYVIPLISSNLLEIKYSNLNELLEISYYKDNLLKDRCVEDIYWVVRNDNCVNYMNKSFYGYLVFYILFSLILVWSVRFIKK